MTKTVSGTKRAGRLELPPWELGHGKPVAKPGPGRVEMLQNNLLLKHQACLAQLLLDSELQLWADSGALAPNPCPVRQQSTMAELAAMGGEMQGNCFLER